MISLWRNNPVFTFNEGETSFPKNFIFPSGRQALTKSIEKIGLNRQNLVAIPDWSSHCVIAAIGKIATPISFKEVLINNIKVDAVLIYDQWGWPYYERSKEDLKKKYSENNILHDQVDSIKPLLFKSSTNLDIKEEGYKSYSQIFSFSKTLGLEGGGAVLFNNYWLESVSNLDHSKLLSSLGKHSSDLVKNFIKSDVSAISNNILDWLDKNNLVIALENENKNRLNNISMLINSPLVNDWPLWMLNYIKENDGVGIVPLFRGKNDAFLNSLHREIAQIFNLNTPIYNFNWNGNLFNSDYSKCLALPLHGMVDDFDDIIFKLSKL